MDLAGFAEAWCRLFGFYSCAQLSPIEILFVGGGACLAAVFVVMTLFGLVTRMVS